MTHKLKTEKFSQKIEYSGGVFFWPLTPLFSFVIFHLNTKRERDSYNLDGTKIKTAHMKSQGDSSVPTDGHKAILNILNSNGKTNRSG